MKTGKAKIQITYFRDETFLGRTASEDVTGDDWQMRSLTSELDTYPDTALISATAVGEGEVEAWFDGFVLTAK